ncbi:DUF6942 family protein [Shewanella sp. GXUN23E]|uniref:DUF6942 family protein n=1 Tax=Shewanella sp. GXUN23E TaxID=3422498 RepID=UPI003D7D5171
MTTPCIGLGDETARISVYIENRPAFMNLSGLDHCQPVLEGEIHAIGQACGNGWRKVFNVYAKLLFALPTDSFRFRQQASTWQEYRDHCLLHAGSDTALLFTPPQLYADERRWHIIMGRTYAKRLVSLKQLNIPLTWLDKEFAINQEYKLLVCPYFDYRQLSNIKIERLAKLMISVSGITD